MASLPMSLEDSSPLIQYSSGWAEPSQDLLASGYSGISLHRSTVIGSTATIEFTGSKISIFGAKRPGYGTYSLTVDGNVISTGNAGSQIEEMKQLLAEATGLAPGVKHTAVLRHEGGAAIDLDRVQFEDVVGPIGSTSVDVATIDDSNARIQYGPTPASWNPLALAGFAEGTYHVSNSADATATLKFNGNAVAVWGAMSPDHADVRISLDGQEKLVPGGGNGLVNGVRPQTLIYYNNGLDTLEHTLVISAEPNSGGGPFLDVDSIAVYSAIGGPNAQQGTTAGPGNNVANATPASEGAPPGRSFAEISQSNKTAMIAGIAGGIAGFLILLGLFAFLFFRRRASKKARKSDMLSPKTPALPMQFGPDLEAGIARREKLTQANSYLNNINNSNEKPRHSRSSSNMSFGSSDAMMDRAQGNPILYEIPQAPANVQFTGGDEMHRVPMRPSRRPSLHLAID